MSDDYYDDVSCVSSVEDTRTSVVDDEPELAEHQRKLCRDKMLGLWRTAVTTAGNAARAEHDRRAAASGEPRSNAWKRPASGGPKN